MGLLERSRHLLAREVPDGEGPAGLRRLVLELERARLELAGAVQSLAAGAAETARQRSGQEARVAELEREIRGALAGEADGAARQAIRAKRETAEAGARLAVELEALERRREAAQDQMARIEDRIRRLQARGRAPAAPAAPAEAPATATPALAVARRPPSNHDE